MIHGKRAQARKKPRGRPFPTGEGNPRHGKHSDANLHRGPAEQLEAGVTARASASLVDLLEFPLESGGMVFPDRQSYEAYMERHRNNPD
jgi:hypothetical protein